MFAPRSVYEICDPCEDAVRCSFTGRLEQGVHGESGALGSTVSELLTHGSEMSSFQRGFAFFLVGRDPNRTP